MARRFVTPEALSVAPEMLGLPLAAPWRRLGAMLVDLVAVAILASLPALVLGLAGAATCVRAGLRPGDAAAARSRWRRGAMFVLAALVLLLAVAGTLLSPGRSVVQVGAGDQRLEMAPSDAIAFVAQTVALSTAGTEGERSAAARALVQSVRAAEPDRAAARALVAEVVAELEDERAKAALQSALDAELPPRDAPEEDAATRALRHDLRQAQLRASQLEEQVHGLRQPQGVRGRLRRVADDLGLGFGWTVVYFTALTAWWKGRTPGKRLFRCRVARLDGRPLTWWHCFNRAGGYAASLATGLLGFAECIWDPNRQALHDRISRTVVLRDERRDEAPAPAT